MTFDIADVDSMPDVCYRIYHTTSLVVAQVKETCERSWVRLSTELYSLSHARDRLNNTPLLKQNNYLYFFFLLFAAVNCKPYDPPINGLIACSQSDLFGGEACTPQCNAQKEFARIPASFYICLSSGTWNVWDWRPSVSTAMPWPDCTGNPAQHVLLVVSVALFGDFLKLIKSARTVDSFKAALKTHLYRLAFPNKFTMLFLFILISVVFILFY